MANRIVKIVVDRGACTGAATCQILAPNAFELDGEGIAVVKASFSDHSDEELIAAAQSCPTQAIKLLDANGEEVK